MVEIDFTRSQIVFSEGDPGYRLYASIDGKIELDTTSKEQLLTNLLTSFLKLIKIQSWCGNLKFKRLSYLTI
jgi:hypothetical protein